MLPTVCFQLLAIICFDLPKPVLCDTMQQFLLAPSMYPLHVSFSHEYVMVYDSVA